MSSTRPTIRSSSCSSPNTRRSTAPLIAPSGIASLPVELFRSVPSEAPADVRAVMDESISVVQKHRSAGTLLNEQNKITQPVLDDLARPATGACWSTSEYGGCGAPFRHFAAFLDADGHGRSDGRRSGVGARLHRRRRSGPHASATPNRSSASCRAWPAANGCRRSP